MCSKIQILPPNGWISNFSSQPCWRTLEISLITYSCWVFSHSCKLLSYWRLINSSCTCHHTTLQANDNMTSSLQSQYKSLEHQFYGVGRHIVPYIIHRTIHTWYQYSGSRRCKCGSTAAYRISMLGSPQQVRDVQFQRIQHYVVWGHNVCKKWKINNVIATSSTNDEKKTLVHAKPHKTLSLIHSN